MKRGKPHKRLDARLPSFLYVDRLLNGLIRSLNP